MLVCQESVHRINRCLWGSKAKAELKTKVNDRKLRKGEMERTQYQRNPVVTIRG